MEHVNLPVPYTHTSIDHVGHFIHCAWLPYLPTSILMSTHSIQCAIQCTQHLPIMYMYPLSISCAPSSPLALPCCGSDCGLHHVNMPRPSIHISAVLIHMHPCSVYDLTMHCMPHPAAVSTVACINNAPCMASICISSIPIIHP